MEVGSLDIEPASLASPGRVISPGSAPGETRASHAPAETATSCFRGTELLARLAHLRKRMVTMAPRSPAEAAPTDGELARVGRAGDIASLGVLLERRRSRAYPVHRLDLHLEARIAGVSRPGGNDGGARRRVRGTNTAIRLPTCGSVGCADAFLSPLHGAPRRPPNGSGG